MPGQIDDLKQMDGATSIAVRKGIGERLRQTFTVDVAMFPTRLQNLIDELRRQDNTTSPHPN